MLTKKEPVTLRKAERHHLVKALEIIAESRAAGGR